MLDRSEHRLVATGGRESARKAAEAPGHPSDIDRFLTETTPFDRLNAEDRRRVADSITLTHFVAGESVLRHLQTPEWLHIVVSGEVDEIDTVGPVARHTAGSAFDVRALIQGRSENSFVARVRTACYLLPWQMFMALSRSNLAFREYFYAELTRHLDAIVAVQQQREAASFLMGRLADSELHPAVFVDADTPMGEAARLMQEHDSTAVLVRRGDEVGIFTDRDLRERHVLTGMPLSTPLGEIASYGLKTTDEDELLFNALVTMTKHGIRHLVVNRGDDIIGIFEQADLLRHLANSSYIIAGKVESARSEEELKEAGNAVPQLVRSLHSRGVKPRYITRIVTDLNRKVFSRLFERLMPEELQGKCCLIVMGSEGRGEQLLRTDQDNGLILANDVPREAVGDVAQRFTAAVAEMGFPPCPGNVMVTNPLWSKSIAEFRADVGRWMISTDGESLLNLAILYDATAVGGDKTLLSELKNHIFGQISREEAFLGHFAKATLSFATPLNWLGRLAGEREGAHRGAIDVKKGGIFPIVHAVRSLGLEYALTETNTISRVEALSGRGPFSEEFTADLIESFDFLCMVRMREQLRKIDRGEPYDNYVLPDRLNKFERRTLRDCFKTVRDLKSYIVEHFRLQLLV
jgi:Predicted signal-transduction protein containing cAMP-binding and CBS domains